VQPLVSSCPILFLFAYSAPFSVMFYEILIVWA